MFTDPKMKNRLRDKTFLSQQVALKQDYTLTVVSFQNQYPVFSAWGHPRMWLFIELFMWIDTKSGVFPFRL